MNRFILFFVAVFVIGAFYMVPRALAGHNGSLIVEVDDCNLQTGNTEYFIDWHNGSGALQPNKYTVCIVCEDPSNPDLQTEFCAGTSECADIDGVICSGLRAEDMIINVSLVAGSGAIAGDFCDATVRVLRPGRDRGRQDKSANSQDSTECDNFP